MDENKRQEFINKTIDSISYEKLRAERCNYEKSGMTKEIYKAIALAKISLVYELGILNDEEYLIFIQDVIKW